MDRKKRDSYILGAIIALLAIAALIGVYLLVRGSDERTSSATAPTTRTTPTQTSRTQTTPTQTAPARSTATEAPTEALAETEAAVAPPAEAIAPPPPAVPLEIIERTAQPDMVMINRPMDFTAKVRGEAVRVTMTIKGDTYEYTVVLNKIATVGGITTWAASAPGPHATGIYHYYASAVGADGVMVEMPGTSGWSFAAFFPG